MRRSGVRSSSSPPSPSSARFCLVHRGSMGKKALAGPDMGPRRSSAMSRTPLMPRRSASRLCSLPTPSHERATSPRPRQADDLLRPRRVSDGRALRAAQRRPRLVRGAQPRRFEGAHRGRGRAAVLRLVAKRADFRGAEARLHPVDQRGHRPVFARRAARGGHSRRERAGRERARGRRARDRADPRHDAADPAGARQPDREEVARHDRRHLASAKTSSAARRS